MSIQELYEKVAAEPTDIKDHLKTLRDLVVDNGMTKVIELGTRWGASSVALLAGLEETGGHLWSVDLSRQWAGIPMTRWTFIVGDDMDIKVRERLPLDADMVFVDTDHRFELTRWEISIYKEHLRSGGQMVFHDTAVEVFPHHSAGTEPPFPVRSAVLEWVALDEEATLVSLTDACNGLAVVQWR